MAEDFNEYLEYNGYDFLNKMTIDFYIYYNLDVNDFFNQMVKYIIKDEIDDNIFYNNFDNKITMGLHDYSFKRTLDKYKNYNNKTWTYFLGLDYYIHEEYDKMLSLFKDVDEPHIYCLLGNYYQKFNRFRLALKNYSKAIDLKNVYAMYCRAENMKDNCRFQEMEEYYMMAIKLNYTDAMCNLGMYYGSVEGNYDLMYKYYTMAIKYNNSNAMYLFGSFYNNIKKYNLMKVYYTMAIELGHRGAYCGLKNYCKDIEKDESKYYEHIYYPRILTIIICARKINLNNILNNKPNNSIFIPEEIFILLFNEYIRVMNKN